MSDAMPTVVCFGEILLRLSPPGFDRLLQTPALSATFGGAEANVAVSLARFGIDSVFVGRVPEHGIGDAAVRALRAEGVRTDRIARGGDRLGIYFAETGAGQRPSAVIYDRAHSAIATAAADTFDWPSILRGADWLHVSGITPALGPQAAAHTATAMQEARRAGATVSFDLNYRKTLWTPVQAQQTIGPLMTLVDVLIANEEDIQSVLGIDVPGARVDAGQLDPDAYRDVATSVAALGPSTVAVTLRESLSASDNRWSAVLWDGARQAFYKSRRYDIRIVDRIGSGDAFAAGLIFSLLNRREPAAALEWAVAAGALKHSIPGDFNRVTVADVDRLAAGNSSGRIHR
jgi:2-dehydro-3-deoxygluconokinase